MLQYDVSRWGRFKHTDASAYYDYHLELHRVRVVYVAEGLTSETAPAWRIHRPPNCLGEVWLTHRFIGVHRGIRRLQRRVTPWGPLASGFLASDWRETRKEHSERARPKQLVQYAITPLKDRVLFGSDYPLITPERWMKDIEEAGFRPEVMPGSSGAMRFDCWAWPEQVCVAFASAIRTCMRKPHPSVRNMVLAF